MARTPAEIDKRIEILTRMLDMGYNREYVHNRIAELEKEREQ